LTIKGLFSPKLGIGKFDFKNGKGNWNAQKLTALQDMTAFRSGDYARPADYEYRIVVFTTDPNFGIMSRIHVMPMDQCLDYLDVENIEDRSQIKYLLYIDFPSESEWFRAYQDEIIKEIDAERVSC